MTNNVMDMFRKLANNEFGFFQKVSCVADVMCTEVPTLTTSQSLADALQLAGNSNVFHAAILGTDNAVAGIISDRDLIRFQSNPPNDEVHSGITLDHVMTPEPHAVRPDASPIEALTVMIDHQVDCVLVYEDPTEPKGFVTPYEFIKALLLFNQVCSTSTKLQRLRLVDMDRGLPPDEFFSRGAKTVRDIMTANPHTLTREATVAQAIALMRKHRFRHVPVVNDQGTVAGLVTDRDVMRVLATPVDSGVRVPEESFREFLFQASPEDPALAQKLSTVTGSKFLLTHPTTLLVNGMQSFLEHQLGGLVVIDADDKKLCGIISTTDVIRVFRIVMRLAAHIQPQHDAAAQAAASDGEEGDDGAGSDDQS